MSADVKAGDTLYVTSPYGKRLYTLTVERVTPKTIRVVGKKDRWDRVERDDGQVAKHWSDHAYLTREDAINSIVLWARHRVERKESALAAPKADLASEQVVAERLRMQADEEGR